MKRRDFVLGWCVVALAGCWCSPAGAWYLLPHTALGAAEMAVGVTERYASRLEATSAPRNLDFDAGSHGWAAPLAFSYGINGTSVPGGEAPDIYGLRIGLRSYRFYQGRPSVYGLDLGCFNDLYVPATHLNRLWGVQVSLAFNEVMSGGGLQASFWNLANQSFWGAQLAVKNELHAGGGCLQVGLLNEMYGGGGLQVGIINHAQPGVYALQIGLLNLGALGCTPLIGLSDFF